MAVLVSWRCWSRSRAGIAAVRTKPWTVPDTHTSSAWVQARSLDAAQAIARVKAGSHKYGRCDHTIEAKARSNTGVCSAWVELDASLHDKGLSACVRVCNPSWKMMMVPI